MYSKMMKVIGAAVLSIALYLGVLAISTTNVVFAADQSSKPASQNPQLDPRVPGWCNFDGDQDKDDWCWTNAPITDTSAYTNGVGLPPGTVFPYGAIIGQTDPYKDAGYTLRYNNNYFFPLPRRFFRMNRRPGGIVVPPGRVIRGRRIFLGRNGFMILNNGKRVIIIP